MVKNTYLDRHFSFTLVVSLFACLVGGCLPIVQSPDRIITPTPASETSTHVAEDIAVITFFEGTVSVIPPTVGERRMGISLILAQSNAPSAFQIVQNGTVIRAEANGSVTIVCYNNQVYRIQGSGSVTVTNELCNSGQPLPANSANSVRSQNGRIRKTDGSNTVQGETREKESDYGQLPIIWSPRNTSLLTTPATITWVAVESALEYVLSLSGLEAFSNVTLDVQQVACEQTLPDGNSHICEVSWPADWRVVAGQRYFLTAAARTGIAAPLRSSESVALRMLPADEVTLVQSDIAQLQALQLDSVTHNLLLAGIYADHQLQKDAIDVYKDVITQQPSPLIWITLGDLYGNVELARPAFDAYNNALVELDEQIAPTSAERAAAEYGLGLVYYGRDNYREAETHLLIAVQLYSESGASEEAQMAQHALDETQKKLP